MIMNSLENKDKPRAKILRSVRRAVYDLKANGIMFRVIFNGDDPSAWPDPCGHLAYRTETNEYSITVFTSDSRC